jgi:hypothetical protein
MERKMEKDSGDPDGSDAGKECGIPSESCSDSEGKNNL